MSDESFYTEGKVIEELEQFIEDCLEAESVYSEGQEPPILFLHPEIVKRHYIEADDHFTPTRVVLGRGGHATASYMADRPGVWKQGRRLRGNCDEG